jgi:serine protease Do
MFSANSSKQRTLKFSAVRALVATVVIAASLVSVAFAQSESATKEPPRPKRGSVELGKGAQAQTDAKLVNELNGIYVKVVEAVAPGVVSITTEKKWSAQQQQFNNPLYEFFGMPQPGVPDERGPRRNIPLGGGSGFVASRDGYIFTNAHVLEGADVVKVGFANRKSYSATIVGMDKKADVAVLKIDAPKGELAPLAFGDAEGLRIGERVLAIGTPFALQNTVTAGIVSAKGRRDRVGMGDSYQDYIQTDAAVNPGNSGGPLVNLRGEVIGINSAIYTRTGGYMGVSFAIPINMAMKIAEDLIYDGKVTRGYLGVQIDDVDENLAGALGLTGLQGALIREVVPNSPAAKGGLVSGDIVLLAAGAEVMDAAHLRNRVADLAPGKAYPFEIWRGGKKSTLNIKVGWRPGEGGDESESAAASEGEDTRGGFSSGKLGLRFESVTEALRQRFTLPGDVKGAVIVEVVDGSAAANSGFVPGMVITQFKRRQDAGFIPVNEAKQLSDAAKAMAAGDQVAFMVHHQGRTDLRALRAR